MKTLTILLAIILLACAQEDRLTYVSQAQSQGKSTDNLITLFSSKQGEILGKVFTHFIQQQIRKWTKSNISATIINERVANYIIGRTSTLYEDMKRFVEERLFAKLDMDKLVDSLQKEIKENPENYYLTFEVYDLLID